MGTHAIPLIAFVLLLHPLQDVPQGRDWFVRHLFELIEQQEELSDSQPLNKPHIHLIDQIGGTVLLDQLFDALNDHDQCERIDPDLGEGVLLVTREVVPLKDIPKPFPQPRED